MEYNTNTGDINNCYYEYPPFSPNAPQTRQVKRVTKTVEKYGPDGEYLGKEIEIIEEEVYDKQVWDTGTITIVGDGITTNDWNHSSGDVTNINLDTPYSLTSSVEQVSFCSN